MPKGIKQSEKVRVDVTDEIKDGEQIYTVTVRCPAQSLHFSDAFANRGLIDPLSTTLRLRALKATEEYLEAPDNYLAKTKAATNGNGNGHHVRAEAAGR